MMARAIPLDAVEDIITTLSTANSDADIRLAMEGITDGLGYCHYAIIHHDDLDRQVPGLLRFYNYPEVWADYFIKRKLYRIDPVVHACARTSHSFFWSDLARLIRLNARHRAILDGAAREGLVGGVTMPWSRPGMCAGSCSFGSPRRGGVPVTCPLALQLIGSFAFSAAARVSGVDAVRIGGSRRLQPRQRECVVLASHGKTNPEIAQILGIKLGTVRQHLDNAMRRYNVFNRAQLVAAAVLDNEIHLTEIAEGQVGRSSNS